MPGVKRQRREEEEEEEEREENGVGDDDVTGVPAAKGKKKQRISPVSFVYLAVSDYVDEQRGYRLCKIGSSHDPSKRVKGLGPSFSIHMAIPLEDATEAEQLLINIFRDLRCTCERRHPERRPSSTGGNELLHVPNLEEFVVDFDASARRIADWHATRRTLVGPISRFNNPDMSTPGLVEPSPEIRRLHRKTVMLKSDIRRLRGELSGCEDTLRAFVQNHEGIKGLPVKRSIREVQTIDRAALERDGLLEKYLRPPKRSAVLFVGTRLSTKELAPPLPMVKTVAASEAPPQPPQPSS